MGRCKEATPSFFPLVHKGDTAVGNLCPATSHCTGDQVVYIYMSFTEICDRFSAVMEQMSHSTLTVRSLANYFKALRRANEAYVQSVEKAFTQLQNDLPRGAGEETLTATLKSFLAGQKKIGELMSNTAG